MLKSDEGSEALNTSRIPQFTRGDRFRKAREKLGLEQGAFAEHIGVSRGTVSNYERDMTVTRKVVASAWWLMDGDTEPDEPFLAMLERAGDVGRGNPDLRAQLRSTLKALMAEEDGAVASDGIPPTTRYIGTGEPRLTVVVGDATATNPVGERAPLALVAGSRALS